MRPNFQRPLLLVLAFVSGAAVLPAQSRNAKDLGVGKFLVASRGLRDPNFAETVILLVEYGEDGAVGLAMNSPTKEPVSRVLQELKGSKGHADPIFMGGPVGTEVVFALLRSGAAPKQAVHMFGDVYLVRTKPVLEKVLAANRSSRTLRIYAGYSGWGPGQLEDEVDPRAWYIFSGVPDRVFDSDPASLWSRMIALTERQIAQSRIH